MLLISVSCWHPDALHQNILVPHRAFQTPVGKQCLGLVLSSGYSGATRRSVLRLTGSDKAVLGTGCENLC